jgi:hypothetical protein
LPVLCVRALQRIALGQDSTATARDRLAALKELLELGAKGTTSYLERPGQSELTERAQSAALDISGRGSLKAGAA